MKRKVSDLKKVRQLHLKQVINEAVLLRSFLRPRPLPMPFPMAYTIKDEYIEKAVEASMKRYDALIEKYINQMLLAGKASGEVAGKGRPKNVTAGNIIPVRCDDLDLSRNESAEAQMLKGPDAFEKGQVSYIALEGKIRLDKALDLLNP